MPRALQCWLVRRRVAISLVGFILLVLFNLVILQTIPLNPTNFTNGLVFMAMAAIAAGLAIRTWSAGALNKSRELTQSGPYALVRNPLYLGSFLMMFGFCVLCRDALSLLFVLGPLAGLYWLQIRFEEDRLRHAFPLEFDRYCAATPRMVPTRLPRNAFSGWTFDMWFRNREYRAMLGTALGIAAIFALHAIRSIH